MEADLQDNDFMQGMQDMLGIDEQKVEKIISSLDADTLSDLTDAVANKDEARAKDIIASVETDEQINSLFRGKIEGEDAKPQEPDKRHVHKVDAKYQYKFGDEVQAEVLDPETHEPKTVIGTVYKTNGPGDTVGIKKDGKSIMVDRDKLNPLKEDGVMGMVGIPNLARMQELAGIQPSQQQSQAAPTQEIEVTTDDDDDGMDTCGAAQQAMQALDVIANVLPNVRLADLKLIRQRILNLQQAMNESVTTERRRKI